MQNTHLQQLHEKSQCIFTQSSSSLASTAFWLPNKMNLTRQQLKRQYKPVSSASERSHYLPLSKQTPRRPTSDASRSRAASSPNGWKMTTTSTTRSWTITITSNGRWLDSSKMTLSEHSWPRTSDSILLSWKRSTHNCNRSLRTIQVSPSCLSAISARTRVCLASILIFPLLIGSSYLQITTTHPMLEPTAPKNC